MPTVTVIALSSVNSIDFRTTKTHNDFFGSSTHILYTFEPPHPLPRHIDSASDYATLTCITATSLQPLLYRAAVA